MANGRHGCVQTECQWLAWHIGVEVNQLGDQNPDSSLHPVQVTFYV